MEARDSGLLTVLSYNFHKEARSGHLGHLPMPNGQNPNRTTAGESLDKVRNAPVPFALARGDVPPKCSHRSGPLCSSGTGGDLAQCHTTQLPNVFKSDGKCADTSVSRNTVSDFYQGRKWRFVQVMYTVATDMRTVLKYRSEHSTKIRPDKRDATWRLVSQELTGLFGGRDGK